MVLLKCPACKNLFAIQKRQSFLQKRSEWTACSRVCRGKFARKLYLLGRTDELKQAISENLVREYRAFPNDNPEETTTMGSVETIRLLPENGKDIVQPTTLSQQGHE